MQLKSRYDYDRKLAEEGKKIDLGEGSYIILAKFGNKRFMELFRKLTMQYAGGKRVDLIDDKTKEDIYLQCMCETVVLDWNKIFDGDTEVAYSPENVKEVFEKYPEFHNDVLEMAKDIATFQQAQNEEDLGNSQASSETNSE